MKAGGAFLPVEPEYPQNRIDFMLEESNAVLFLTQSPLMFKAKFFAGLDLNNGKIYAAAGKNLPLINRVEDLAYVIYTLQVNREA